MNKKLIDYDLTIKKFFDSVVTFLKKSTEKAKTKKEYENILKTIEVVNKISQNPKKYSDYRARVKENLEPDVDAFCKKNQKGIVVDNSVWLAFSKVLYAIDGYYNGFGIGKENDLLKAIKNWKYKTSTSFFKDFVFPFKSIESFAARVSIEKIK